MSSHYQHKHSHTTPARSNLKSIVSAKNTKSKSNPQSFKHHTPPTTPTAMSSTAHQLVDEIRSIYTGLSGLSSLAPSPQVNSLLTRLVELCIQPYSSDFSTYVLAIKSVDELCLALRPLCANAEGELESYWANEIIASSTYSVVPSITRTRELLTSFPYYGNYIDLSRLECSTLEAFLPTCSSDCRPTPCKLAFIGSGPLPLTSFCVLDRYPEAVVHNIDRDGSALRVSKLLSEGLGYGDRMSFSCEDVSVKRAAESTDWSNFQVVFLAALVGMDTPSKLAILESLALKLEPGTLVVVRSAQGLRGVLYPIFELSDSLQNIGYEILVVAHPWTKVVNSIVVLRVREH